MPYALRPGLSFCRVADRTLFLDARQDRYFCLAPTAEIAFGRLLAGDPLDIEDGLALDRLAADDLLRPSQVPVPIAPCAPPARPRASLLDRPMPRAGPLEIAAAYWHYARVKLDLRRRGFDTTLARTVQRKPAIASHKTAGATVRTMTAFATLGGAIGSHDRCLPLSLALARRLYALGQPVEIVIGVKLQPFQAHCWVQMGDLLVNERHDVTRTFTPILVL